MALPYKLDWKRFLALLAIAFTGTAVVVVGLVAMNSLVQGPEEDGGQSTVSFSVPPPPEQPPPDRPEPRQREPRRSNQPALAPPPNLGSSLSGIAVSLPEFQAEGVRDISESLFGDLENVALTESTVDQPPVTQNAPPPPYPERAKQREIEGQVRVSVLVGSDGEVSERRVLRRLPRGASRRRCPIPVETGPFVPQAITASPWRRG